MKDRRAVLPLIAALHDPQSDVRRACLLALIQLGDARAIEPLIADMAAEQRMEPHLDLEVDYALVFIVRASLHQYLEGFRGDPEKWRKWWAANKQNVRATPVEAP
jgi:HEAT repeat protein